MQTEQKLIKRIKKKQEMSGMHANRTEVNQKNKEKTR